jgi:hypothetical protein
MPRSEQDIARTGDVAKPSPLASAWRKLDHELNRYTDNRLAAA